MNSFEQNTFRMMVSTFTKVANFASSLLRPLDRAHAIKMLRANSLDAASLWNLGIESQ
jgi:hypothetical protein